MPLDSLTVVPLLELRERLEAGLLTAAQACYGARLHSLLIYGSTGRGTFSINSDVDLLVVAESLPVGRMARVGEFERVEKTLGALLSEIRARGWQVELSPIFRTPAEVEIGSPLFLDMTEDARVLLDRNDLMARRLDRLRARLKRLGSRRIWQHDIWYWDLKPDFQPGDRIEL